MTDALDRQVGGDHYKDCKIQPVAYIHANGLGFLEGNVVKYITRHRAKGGRADIEKVIHYAELLLALEYPCPEATTPTTSSGTRKPPSKSRSERPETRPDTTLSAPEKFIKATEWMSITADLLQRMEETNQAIGGSDPATPTAPKET